jgi:hypothetical protein
MQGIREEVIDIVEDGLRWPELGHRILSFCFTLRNLGCERDRRPGLRICSPLHSHSAIRPTTNHIGARREEGQARRLRYPIRLCLLLPPTDTPHIFVSLLSLKE